jgi:hypothetical protein
MGHRLLAALMVLATIAGPLAWACPCAPRTAAHEHDCCPQGSAFVPVPGCCRSTPEAPAATQAAALGAPAPGPVHAPVAFVSAQARALPAPPVAVLASPPSILRI